MPILPLLQNYKNEQWNQGILLNSISTESERSQLIASILAQIEKYKFSGITLDIEEVPAKAQTDLYILVDELHKEFNKRGLLLAQAVPFDDPDWNYRAYAAVTDYLMLMAYDQHWSEGEPGPVAGQDWFDAALKKRMGELSPSKTIVCFGNYGYDWTRGGKEAVTVSFQESLLAAKDSLDRPEDIRFDDRSQNPTFSYEEDDGKTHTVWFLDAVTAFNQIRSAEGYQAAGLALWRLGSEDPALWKVFGTGIQAQEAAIRAAAAAVADRGLERLGQAQLRHVRRHHIGHDLGLAHGFQHGSRGVAEAQHAVAAGVVQHGALERDNPGAARGQGHVGVDRVVGVEIDEVGLHAL